MNKRVNDLVFFLKPLDWAAYPADIPFRLPPKGDEAAVTLCGPVSSGRTEIEKCRSINIWSRATRHVLR
jgi:hypothetical protein